MLGGAAPAALAVEVPQNIIIDLTGDLFLLQHLLYGLSRSAGQDWFSLLGRLLWLDKLG